MNTQEQIQQVIDEATELLCSMINIKEPPLGKVKCLYFSSPRLHRFICSDLPLQGKM